MLAMPKKFVLSWGEGVGDSGSLCQTDRRVELRPEAAIGGMPCAPDGLWRGVAPRCHLLVFIALGIPRQDMTLAERHPRSTKSRQLQSCQEEEVKPVVLL